MEKKINKAAHKIEKETNPNSFENIKDKLVDAGSNAADAIGNLGSMAKEAVLGDQKH